MCGIVAVISKNNIEKELVENMLNRIAHRGYDERNIMYENGVVLAHNRLSIVGNNGSQPLKSNDRNKYAIVNGEFYDYKKIKNNLRKNHIFETETDSEIIIPLYEKYGLNKSFFESLNGEFAVIIYDKKQQKIIAFRDRFGVKPLYYYKRDKSFYFSSEIKSFLDIDKLEFDSESLNSVLYMQYHSDDSTLIKDVRQVPAGSVVEIDLVTMNVKEWKYWDINYKPVESMSFEEAKFNLREVLKKSVEDRMDVKRKKAITLSGGIDSSVIWSLASQCSPKELDAYSVSFLNGGDYDEIKLAEEMCNKYNGNFNPVIVTETDMLDNLENAVYHSEEVSINSHLPAKFLLFKAMERDNIKVSLSGEGADELLLGYPHFKLDLENNNNNINANKYLSGLQTPDKKMLDTSIIKERLGFVPKFLEAKYSMGEKLQRFALDDSYISGMNDPIDRILKNLKIPKMENVYTSSYLWSKICLGNYILTSLGDKMEMASNIEGRVPFLDVNVYNAVKNMPTEFKMNKDSVEKYILKETFKTDITQSIYKKQKHPFIAPPLFGWGNKTNNVKECLYDIVHSSNIKNSDYFSQSKLIDLLKKVEKSNDIDKARFDPIIMLILTTYYFEKNFIKKGC